MLTWFEGVEQRLTQSIRSESSLQFLRQLEDSMTVFHHQLLNRTRAILSWFDESSTIELACVSESGRIFLTPHRGFFNFCTHYANAYARGLVSQCGRIRFEQTLASRPFWVRRFQLNQGALPSVEVDRAFAAKRKQLI